MLLVPVVNATSYVFHHHFCTKTQVKVKWAGTRTENWDVFEWHPPWCHWLAMSQIVSSFDTVVYNYQIGVSMQESELLSLARSLLVAWSDPLAALLNDAPNLVHPDKGMIYSKTKELQEHSNSLGSGLDHLTNKVRTWNLGEIWAPDCTQTNCISVHIIVYT